MADLTARSSVDGFEVVVDQFSLRRDLDNLALFAPELRRMLTMQLKEEAGEVASLAGKYISERQQYHVDVPTAGDAYKVFVRPASGIVRIMARTRGTQITEFAGRKTPGGKTPRGATLIQTLNERYGPTGRVLWHSMDSMSPVMLANIARLVGSAEHELNVKLAMVSTPGTLYGAKYTRTLSGA